MGNGASMQAPDAPIRWTRFTSASALERFGARIAPHLAPGEAVCLSGPLGAGKSTLARGLIRALTSAEEETPSPTFTLMQVYETQRFPLAHFDLYRLRGPEEAFEIGLDEALDVGAAVVEWSERLGDALPPARLEMTLALTDPTDSTSQADERWASWRGVGAWREKAMRLGG